MDTTAKKRILVVDDEPSVLITYRLIMEQQGYDVVPALTSKEAISALDRQTMDLLLCDLSLEEQHTGFEVIEHARAKKGDVPAILLTGYATKDAADKAEKDNIAVLFKPIDIQEFLTKVNDLLR